MRVVGDSPFKLKSIINLKGVNTMQVDPKYAAWFGVWTTILMMIGGGTISLTNTIPDTMIPHVVAWALLFGTINSAILTALHFYSSDKTGPLVKESEIPRVDSLTTPPLRVAQFESVNKSTLDPTRPAA